MAFANLLDLLSLEGGRLTDAPDLRQRDELPPTRLEVMPGLWVPKRGRHLAGRFTDR
jgi:hypothetical protein